MNDEKLANEIVALKVVDAIITPPDDDDNSFVLRDDANRWQSIPVFVRDWDVAGAVLKRVADEGFHISMGSALAGEYDCHMDHLENDMRQYSTNNKSLPRAINETGVKVFKNDST